MRDRVLWIRYFLRNLCLSGLACAAVTYCSQAQTATPSPAEVTRVAADKVDKADDATREYELGADDQLSVWVTDAPDISAKSVTVDLDGKINLPLIGRVRAAGLTMQQLEAELRERLREYFVHPEVVVSVVEYRSQPVSVIGAVNQPGVHQLRGHKRLIEVLSLAGGIRTDAGYTVKITRRLESGPIELPDAKADATGQYSVAEVYVKEIMSATNPQSNILIRPNDVISVPRAEMVYVIGTVMKSGGFVLTEQAGMTVLQALSLAGGLGPQAAGQNARILSAVAGRSTKTETPVNVKKILQGKAKDISLKADDILFVPDSTSKKAAIRLAESALATATGVAVFRSGR
jgi:polysaccharide biosynthesis/export protein